MTTLANYLPQGLFLAGTLSLANAAGCGTASPTDAQGQAIASASVSASSLSSASSSATPPPPAASSAANTVDIPLQGRAGIATMCIETRSYVDPQSGKIITPSIYISKMPDAGIDTLYFKGSPAALKWEQFLKPANEERKAWLNDTDIPAQANAAFDLMKKLDKDGNGIVTAAEFEKGEKGVTKEDQLTDLAFLMSLRCDNLFLNEGPLNTVDPETFPLVQGLRQTYKDDMAKAARTIATARSERDDAQNFFYGMCAFSGFLAMGLVVSMARGRRKGDAAPTTKNTGSDSLTPIANTALNVESVLKALRAIDGRLAKHFNENGKGLNNAGKPIATIGELAKRLSPKALKKAEKEIKTLGDLTNAGNASKALFALIAASVEESIKFQFDDAKAREAARGEFAAALAAGATPANPVLPVIPTTAPATDDADLIALIESIPDSATPPPLPPQQP